MKKLADARNLAEQSLQSNGLLDTVKLRVLIQENVELTNFFGNILDSELEEAREVLIEAQGYLESGYDSYVCHALATVQKRLPWHAPIAIHITSAVQRHLNDNAWTLVDWYAVHEGYGHKIFDDERGGHDDNRLLLRAAWVFWMILQIELRMKKRDLASPKRDLASPKRDGK